MHSHIGSLRYDATGRKRKTKALSTAKRPTARPFKPMAYTQSLAEKQMDEHLEKYPSKSLSPVTQSNIKDDSWKKEASKNFTVAPAYNKGAYQVIPRDDVELIGR